MVNFLSYQEAGRQIIDRAKARGLKAQEQQAAQEEVVELINGEKEGIGRNRSEMASRFTNPAPWSPEAEQREESALAAFATAGAEDTT